METENDNRTADEIFEDIIEHTQKELSEKVPKSTEALEQVKEVENTKH